MQTLVANSTVPISRTTQRTTVQDTAKSTAKNASLHKAYGLYKPKILYAFNFIMCRCCSANCYHVSPDHPALLSPPLQFGSVAQMNPNMVFSAQGPVFYPAGTGLMHQGQPMLYPTYSTMFPPQMLMGPGGQQQQMMFPPQQTTSTAQMQASKGSRHNLPTTQASSQKYPQQPQQPSTQLQPKAQATTKRATKALIIVDPDTNEPFDLVGVSNSSKSKSPKPASVTNPTQDAKREVFMAKISGKSNISEDSNQPEPNSEYTAGSTQHVMPHTTESPLRADSTSSKGLSRFGIYTQFMQF